MPLVVPDVASWENGAVTADPVEPTDDLAVSDRLATRPPRQQRSREAWSRILNAGVELLEDAGYDSFTVPGVCARAAVAPRAVYERVDSKEELFAAVYEYGMGAIAADQALALADEQWSRSDPVASIRALVAAVVGLFAGHERFLRTVILTSASRADLLDRGRNYAADLRAGFSSALEHAATRAGVRVQPAVIDVCFTAVFSTLMIRTSYGPDYATDLVDDDDLTDQLTAMIVAHLLGGPRPVG